MKMLLILYSGPDPDRISSMLEEHRVTGWTELDHAHGVGRTGRLEGSRAWPGDTTLFFTVIEDERAGVLTAALRQRGDHAEQGERLHAMVLPVESFF